MNILILSWRGPGHPNSGGAEISTHEHAKGWIKAGHSVTLFSSHYTGAKHEEVVDGVKIIRRGKEVFGVQFEVFTWYVFDNHETFDLVIDQFHGIPFFTPLYIRKKKLAFIHEVVKEVWVLNPWPRPFNLIPAILGKFLEPFVFQLYKSTPFMTVSESSKKDLVKWGIPGNNITIIHNGVNLPKSKILPKKENKKTVIFLGSLTADKGVENVISAFGKLNQKIQNMQFWIVGKGTENFVHDLKSKSKKAGLIKNITFWGYVSDEKKFNLLSRAHILANTSVREGWGLVVIEAAGVGTPTVGFNVPGLRDSIKDKETGILCLENTPEDLAKNILNLLEDEQEYKRIRSKALSWSKKFSWEKSYSESLKLIEGLV